MAATTMTSREFNQDTGRAKRAASSGPVIITDRGRPVHVLLSYEDYERLTGGGVTILDLLGLPEGTDDIELDLPDMRDHADGADLD